MNADFTADDLAFQAEVKDFLEKEFPSAYRKKIDARQRLTKEEIVDWQKILFRKWWVAPNWPKEYGGTGWSPTQKYIFSTEM